MNFFPVAFSFGLFLLGVAFIVSWPAPILLVRLSTSVALFILACIAPWQVGKLMGYPVPAGMMELPQKAELVAFVPHDRDGTVDLWLKAGTGVPRAYETVLDGETKKMLQAAQDQLAHGKRVGLKKNGERKKATALQFSDAPAPYIIDEQFLTLPKKDQ